MRFRLLLEAPVVPTGESSNNGTSTSGATTTGTSTNNKSNYLDVLMDKSASREDRFEACIKYAQDYGYRGILNILQKKDDKANKLFDTLLLTFNYEQDVKNKCYFILSKLQIESVDSKNYPNFVTLCDTLNSSSDFDHKQKYLTNPSLYNRSAQDFSYTLNVMDIVHNKSKLVKYYDPDKIDTKYLFDGNNIKPAGIMARDPEDFDTIYGVLELWKETSANENTSQRAKGNSSTEQEFSSFEEAEKDHQNQDGNVIKVNGKFRFNAKDKKWEPLKK